MPNNFYDHTTVPPGGASLSSAQIRAEFNAIEAGFDRMPVLTGNANKAVFVNAGASGLTAVAASAARTLLGLGMLVTISAGAANQLSGMDAAGSVHEWKTLSGTANQVTVTHGVGTVTLALPQNVHTAATPTFADVTVTGAFIAPAGSAGTPSIAIGTTAGLYQASASQVGVTVNSLAIATFTTGGLTISRTGAGADRVLVVANTSNSASSNAIVGATVAGTSAGDPFTRYTVGTTSGFAVGVDTSDSRSFKISYAASASAVLGTNDYLTITTAGVTTITSLVATIADINGGTLDGVAIGGASPSTGAFTTVSATGQITSSVTTGTAPLVIASTTAVANLNASLLLGNTWAIPGSIGSTTPNAGAFTTLSASGTVSANGGDLTTSQATFNLLNATATTINFGGAATALNIGSALMCIGDTSNANMTVGLTINQDANDNEILAFKSSDIAHGTTALTETDTYGLFKKTLIGGGGLRIESYTEVSQGMYLYSVATSEATAKNSSATANLQIDIALKSGTGAGAHGANANLVSISNNGTTRFIFDADGDSHQDVGTAWTNFDHLDDVATLDALSYNVARAGDPIKRKFGEWMVDRRSVLTEQRLVSFNDDGHHFVNMSRLTMLNTGAIRQIHEQMVEQRDALSAQIAALDSKLHRLEAR